MPTVENIYLKGLHAIIDEARSKPLTPELEETIKNAHKAIERFFNHGLTEPVVELRIPAELL